MSTVFSRTINIYSHDLGKTSTLLLSFDKLGPGMFKDYFPIVWKVSEFGDTGSFVMSATFQSQLAFCKPQLVNDTIVAASTWVDINMDQVTTLTKPAPNRYQFSAATEGPSGVMEAFNKTGDVQDMTLGFATQLSPTSVLLFPGVGDGEHVTAQFTPILRAYITSDYTETEVLRGEIDSDVIWENDIATLAEVTSWTLTRDPASGHYQIMPVMMI